MSKEKDLYTRIQEQHDRSFKNLFRLVVSERKLICSYQLWSSVVLTILYVLYVLLANIDALAIMDIIARQSIAILPTVIGCNIGGYVLFVSIGASNIINHLVDKYEGGGDNTTIAISTYQHISSVFAWSIFIQILAFMLSYAYVLIISLEIQSSHANIINTISLFVILMLSLYAILLIYRIVMNVFTIGQVQHFHEVCDKIENQNKEDEKAKDK